MIDADGLIELMWNGGKEGYNKFFANKNIIPITDDYIKFEDTIYELEPVDIRALTDFRTAKGYDRLYDGPEREPGDAEVINGLYLSSVENIARMIKFGNEGKLSEGIRYKIVNKKGE